MDEEKNLEKINLIHEYRAKARGLRDANNLLVDQIWEIDHQLANPVFPENERPPLMEKKAQLMQEVEKNAFMEKFESLLLQINQLETEVYGHSDVNSHSPFEL